ncbi:MAG: hypothetical protein JWP66_954 [Naasia sp.]|nr:hypothetical protein [Naasia sp.]
MGSTEVPTPVATTPEPAPVATLVIATEGVALATADGDVLAEFSYFDSDVETVSQALADAFGVDPEVTHVEAVTHFPAERRLVWPGFELTDPETEARFPELPTFSVAASAGDVAGIDVRTGEGVRVGMSGAEVEPLSYRHWVDTGGLTAWTVYLLDQVPVQISGADYEPAALSTRAVDKTSDGVVDQISAPGRNWGA